MKEYSNFFFLLPNESLHSIHLHFFPFLYFKTSKKKYLIPFYSFLFHSFPLFNYISFNSLINSQKDSNQVVFSKAQREENTQIGPKQWLKNEEYFLEWSIKSKIGSWTTFGRGLIKGLLEIIMLRIENKAQSRPIGTFWEMSYKRPFLMSKMGIRIAQKWRNRIEPNK